MKNVCKLFLEHHEKISWFIKRYFGDSYFIGLVTLARQGKEKELFTNLNDIWFRLPDHIFNIQENPPGWSEFLDIIEV